MKLKVELDYPVNVMPRYGWGKPAHPKLQQMLSEGSARYEVLLRSFLRFTESALEIPLLPDGHKNALIKHKEEIVYLKQRSFEGCLTAKEEQRAALIQTELKATISEKDPTWLNGFFRPIIAI